MRQSQNRAYICLIPELWRHSEEPAPTPQFPGGETEAARGLAGPPLRRGAVSGTFQGRTAPLTPRRGCTQPGQEVTERCGQVMQKAVAGILFFIAITLHSGNTHSPGVEGGGVEAGVKGGPVTSGRRPLVNSGALEMGQVHSLKVL